MEIEVGLLTGGQDKPYALGLAMSLASRGIWLDFIGSDELDCPELHATAKLSFLNLRGNMSSDVPLSEKSRRILLYYFRLLSYVATARPKVLHVLWNNRFEYFDRTLLMAFYRIIGKRIVLTAHNVNIRKRDKTDTLLNRLTLRIQYRLCSHIFVHTEKMKVELTNEFGVQASDVSVIPFGINETVPNTELTSAQAKRRLGISEDDKTILFFGRIGRYKGLEFLVEAFQKLAEQDTRYHLIVVGKPKGGCEEYVESTLRTIRAGEYRNRVIQKIEFVPDEDTEIYFKAADILALPYTDIFQSGLIFLAYNFGLPVVATDVGSFREEVIEGSTGFICKPRDPAALQEAFERYFESDLFKNLSNIRQKIREHGRTRHSWDVVGEMTRKVYVKVV